jgi:hypothetical protein
MSDVFISFGSADRERARAVSKVLQAAGIPCWMDEERIRPGYVFHEEIVKAIKAARLFLLLCSTQSMRNRYVIQEVHVAWSQSKLYLPVLLEPLAVPHDLPDGIRIALEGIQFVKFHGGEQDELDTLLARSVRDRLLVAESPESPATNVPARHALRSADTAGFRALMVDRSLQRNDVTAELQRRAETLKGRPLLFFVHGQEDECVEAFLDRLHQLDLPTVLRRMSHSDEIQWHDCGWPPAHLSPEERLRWMRRELADCLDLNIGASLEQIHDRIVRFRSSIAFSFHISARDWRPEDKALLSIWSKLWAALPEIPNPSILMFFVSVKYPISTGWAMRTLLGQQRFARIRKELTALESELPIGLGRRTVAELTAIPQPDTERWAREVAKPDDMVAMMRDIRELYRNKSLVRNERISMEPLSLRLRELIEIHRPSRRV